MLNPADEQRFRKAAQIYESGRTQPALDIVNELLEDNPLDDRLFGLAALCYERFTNRPVAYAMLRLATTLNPQNPVHWLNLGRVAEDLWLTSEAERHYQRALRFAKGREATQRMTLGNLSALCVDNARYVEAQRYAEQVLARWPDDDPVRGNLGFAQLGLRNWAEGWANYRHAIATGELSSRRKIQICGEPMWDGTPGLDVLLYGEQGIGDEISFASMVPDAAKRCRKTILECDMRLSRLFERSFPGVTVYGTRQAKDGHTLWPEEDRKVDASLPVGQVGEYVRTRAEDFPGTPYLVADPERVLMWRSLWAAKRKPVSGIAWKGGTQKTGKRFRRWSLEKLLPVLRSVDAHWVVLEYKSASSELATFHVEHPEIDIREYPYATLTNDYDDTAALVASLDLVLCIQTAVAHLGGALGVPTWVCVPPISQWRYGATETSVPWYNSVRVLRQRNGQWDFKQIGDDLASHFRGLSRAAADAA